MRHCSNFAYLKLDRQLLNLKCIHNLSVCFSLITMFNKTRHFHVPADYLLFFFAVYSPVLAGNFCTPVKGNCGGRPIFILSITQYMIFIPCLMIPSWLFGFFVQSWKIIEHVLYFNFVCPGQELLPRQGWGLGGVGLGANKDQYLFYPSSNIWFLAFKYFINVFFA